MGNPFVFRGLVNEVYPEAVSAILQEGDTVGKIQSGGAVGRSTLEINPAIFSITDSSNPFVMSKGRTINIAFALAELIGILIANNTLSFIEGYNKQIKNYADENVFWGHYGKRLRVNDGDQIKEVIRKLNTDPNSRQAVMTLWDPELDNVEGMKDYPCNIASHLMIRDGKLVWTQFMRSNDAIWGTPYNFIQFMVMQNYIASCLNVDVGTYTHISDSFHIYEDHVESSKNIQSNQKLITKLGLYEYVPEDYRVPNLSYLSNIERNARLGSQVLFESEGVGKFWIDVYYVLSDYWKYKMDKMVNLFKRINNSAYPSPLDLILAKNFYQWKFKEEDGQPAWFYPEKTKLYEYIMED